MIDQKLLETLYKSKERQLKDFLEKIPQQVLPIITQKDVINGYVIRYFVKQVNDHSFIVEVDRQQYEDFKSNPRFITTQLKWKIVGKKETIKMDTGVNINGVADQNRIAVANADLTFQGLSNYITTYLEYWFAEE